MTRRGAARNRGSRRLAALACGLLAACAGAERELPVALTYRVDPDRARAVGWAPAGASDAEAVRATLVQARRRLDALGLGLRVTELEPGRVEVGPLDRLVAADRRGVDALLTSAGQLELLLVAEPRDLGPPSGPDRLAAGAEAFAAWRAAHPGGPASDHDALAPAAGGPDPRLSWFEDGEGRPVPALLPDRPSAVFGGALLEGVVELGWNTPPEDPVPAYLQVERAHESAAEAFGRAAHGRRLLLVVDGEASVHEIEEGVRWRGSGLALAGLARARVRAASAALLAPGPLVRD